MGRPAKPWFRKSMDQWYATLEGYQTPLGVFGPDQFELAFAEMLRRKAARMGLPVPDNPVPIAPAAPPRTVAEAAAEFLAKRKPKISPECWRQYDITLRVHFLPVFGTRPLSSLTGEEIEDWGDRPAWSSSTRNNNLGTIQTFLKWAKNPLTISRPPKESRGAEAVLTDEQFAKVLESAENGSYGSDLVPLLRLLRETGGRPQEIARLTVENVDWVNSCCRTKNHKSRRHGGERVIYFNSAAVAILEKQRKRYGAGHLLRTRNGNPWRPAAIVKRMADVSERCGIHATAYGAGRHSFANNALSAGVSDTVVAALLGHRGTAMLHKHYSHIDGNSRLMKEALEKMEKAG